MTTQRTLEKLANDETQSSATRRIAGALASAINDWPTLGLDSLDAYILMLRGEVGNVLSWENVRAKCDSYSYSYGDAWKAESLSGLLDVWAISDREIVLDELLSRVTFHV